MAASNPHRHLRSSRRAAAAGAAVACAGALLAIAPAAHARVLRFRVVKATHASAASGQDTSPQFQGSASVSWHLAPATRKAPNIVTIGASPIGVSGSGRMNLTGVYKEDATLEGNHCSLVAPTGSRKYGLVSPGPDQLTIGGNGRTLTAMIGGLGGAMMATGLGNPYFGGPCEDGQLGDPDNAQDRARTGHISYAALTRRRRVVIHVAGGYDVGKATAHWDTRIVLQRIGRHRRHAHHRSAAAG
jgi:hypothetical protein